MKVVKKHLKSSKAPHRSKHVRASYCVCLEKLLGHLGPNLMSQKVQEAP